MRGCLQCYIWGWDRWIGWMVIIGHMFWCYQFKILYFHEYQVIHIFSYSSSSFKNKTLCPRFWILYTKVLHEHDGAESALKTRKSLNARQEWRLSDRPTYLHISQSQLKEHWCALSRYQALQVNVCKWRVKRGSFWWLTW